MPKLKVKLQSVLSDDDVRKRLPEKPRFEMAAKVVFRLGSGKMLHFEMLFYQRIRGYFYNEMRYINLRFTYFTFYLLTYIF